MPRHISPTIVARGLRASPYITYHCRGEVSSPDGQKRTKQADWETSPLRETTGRRGNLAPTRRQRAGEETSPLQGDNGRARKPRPYGR